MYSTLLLDLPFMPETSQVTSWFSGLEPATNWLGEWLGNLGHG
jgi:hypothetical protein